MSYKTSPMINETPCYWQDAITDLRDSVEVDFVEGWLPTVLDSIICDPDCGPTQIAKLLCVVRDRYASILGQIESGSMKPLNLKGPRKDGSYRYDLCSCGNRKLRKSSICSKCKHAGKQTCET